MAYSSEVSKAVKDRAWAKASARDAKLNDISILSAIEDIKTAALEVGPEHGLGESDTELLAINSIYDFLQFAVEYQE